MKKIGCVSMVMNKSWRWFQYKIKNSNDFEWEFYNLTPKNIFEKKVKKPNIARLRACYEAGRDYKKGKIDILISHLPNYSAWAEFFAGKKKKGFHIAFSFNFTKMPSAKMKIFMERQFKKIDRFTVFSNYEKKYYSEYFNIPIEKIDMIHWGVQKPNVVDMERVIKGEYICAIGGEGRDYATLAKAAELLPDLKFVIVARKKNLEGIVFPNNVELFTNLPLDNTINILVNSMFAIVSLETSKTPCGHVTIVSGMHLGKAQIVTYSEGVTDYIIDRNTGVFTEAKNYIDMRDKIVELCENKELREKIEESAKKFAEEYCTEEANVKYFENLLKTINK